MALTGVPFVLQMDKNFLAKLAVSRGGAGGRLFHKPDLPAGVEVLRSRKQEILVVKQVG